MKLPLVYYPDPRLNEPSKKLVPDSDRGVGHVSAVQKLCSDLIDTMEAEKGIGISAIQIGEPVRVGIIHKDAGIPPFAKGGSGGVRDEHLVVINPKIFSASREMEDGEEGCLSIPGVYGRVLRHKKIKVRFLDLEGQEQKIKATGLFSRVLQHEIDHMDGVLFTERASKITKGAKDLDAMKL